MLLPDPYCGNVYCSTGLIENQLQYFLSSLLIETSLGLVPIVSPFDILTMSPSTGGCVMHYFFSVSWPGF